MKSWNETIFLALVLPAEFLLEIWVKFWGVVFNVPVIDEDDQ